MLGGQIEKYAQKLLPLIIDILKDKPELMQPLVQVFMRENLKNMDIDLTVGKTEYRVVIKYEGEVIQDKTGVIHE